MTLELLQKVRIVSHVKGYDRDMKEVDLSGMEGVITGISDDGGSFFVSLHGLGGAGYYLTPELIEEDND